MRVFKGPWPEEGEHCPVCHTRANLPQVAVPKEEATPENRTVEAELWHKECYDHIVKMAKQELQDRS